ncbi:MAG TPA: CYTH domain-containing protein [Candidatus Saccharimonadales bacterium]|nr:CYTH domain-containing protein [Candidatus Saccharimonadales bacterium]
MEEIEVKFLNIDVEEIESKLKSLGAKKEFDQKYRRKVYDYPDLRLNDQGAWIRVRDEGSQVTMGFKQRKMSDDGANDVGMKEIEIKVDSFDKAWQFLEAVGLKQKFYEENRRVRWTLDTIEFDIDYWPLLKPYLEIEAGSWKDIDKAIKILDLNPDDKKIFSTFQVYQLEGINELEYDILTFDSQIKKSN